MHVNELADCYVNVPSSVNLFVRYIELSEWDFEDRHRERIITREIWNLTGRLNDNTRQDGFHNNDRDCHHYKTTEGLCERLRALVEIASVMQTHGNLTASYLWQPAEFARRMLGERPSPVPPTRDLWPPPQQPLSISTLHVAYLHDEPLRRRSSTLPPQVHVSTPAIEQERATAPARPRVCTVGTNTDPPPTVYSRIRNLFKRRDEDIVITPTPQPPTGRLTVVPRETTFDVNEDENRARRTLNEIRKAITGAKYRIAPRTETVDSPKIVYDVSKPGDRMTTTFGASERRRWCKVPSRAACGRKVRALGAWCRMKPRRPPGRHSQPIPLQITQV